MRVSSLAVFVLLLLPGLSQAQKNFIVTVNDSIFHGYLRFTSIDGVQVMRFTEDKKSLGRQYHLNDLKYYSYKKDTIAILRDFYPFPEDERYVDLMEAKILISKGALRLYYGVMPVLSDRLSVAPVIGPGFIGATVYREPYATYIVKDREGQLQVIRHDNDGFRESILEVVGSDKELADQIKSGKMKFKDTVSIVRGYNSRK